MKRSAGARLPCAASTSDATRDSVESSAGREVLATSAPVVFSVPAKSSSPACLSTGTDSPVIGAWSTLDVPDSTVASSGIRSPGRIAIRAPTSTVSTSTSRSPPSTITRARAGARSISDATVRRLRSSAIASKPVPTANSTSTHAPSAYSPIPTAPTAASAISTFMSRRRRPRASTAARAIGQPPTTIESRYSGSATTRGADASDATTASASRPTDSVVDSARASRRQNGVGSVLVRRTAGCAR